MKIKLQKLRQIVKEEFVLSNAIPDFVLIQALDKTTDALRRALMQYVQTRIISSTQKRIQAEALVEEFLSAFKQDVRDCFEKRLLDFLNKV